jgi:hypothetical protein
MERYCHKEYSREISNPLYLPLRNIVNIKFSNNLSKTKVTRSNSWNNKSPCTYHSKDIAKLKFLISRPSTKWGSQGQTFWYPWKGLVTRKTRVIYQICSTYHSKSKPRLMFLVYDRLIRQKQYAHKSSISGAWKLIWHTISLKTSHTI